MEDIGCGVAGMIDKYGVYEEGVSAETALEVAILTISAGQLFGSAHYYSKDLGTTKTYKTGGTGSGWSELSLDDFVKTTTIKDSMIDLNKSVGDIGDIGKSGSVSNVDDYVDLTDFRKDHILNNHRFGAGKPDKTEFPQSWSDEKILHYVSDVATDPNANWGMGKWDSPYAISVREGIEIRVDFYPEAHPKYSGKISTAYPLNTPQNPPRGG